jgi:histidyl-tRNA synthetase
MLKQADRSGARYVAILGDEETILKDMESGEQEQLEPVAIVASVLKGRHLA